MERTFQESTQNPSWCHWQIHAKYYRWPTRPQTGTVYEGRTWRSIKKINLENLQASMKYPLKYRRQQNLTTCFFNHARVCISKTQLRNGQKTASSTTLRKVTSESLKTSAALLLLLYWFIIPGFSIIFDLYSENPKENSQLLSEKSFHNIPDFYNHRSSTGEKSRSNTTCRFLEGIRFHTQRKSGANPTCIWSWERNCYLYNIPIENTRAMVCSRDRDTNFDIVTRVLQEDTLALYLFIHCADYVIWTR